MSLDYCWKTGLVWLRAYSDTKKRPFSALFLISNKIKQVYIRNTVHNYLPAQNIDPVKGQYFGPVMYNISIINLFDLN